jgi:protein SCO1/2
MSGGIRNTLLACGAFIVVVLGAFYYSVTREPPPLSVEQLRSMGVYLLPQPRELQPFSLPSDADRPFDNAALEGRWTLAYFGFTFCPDICPTTMAALGKAQAALREAGVAEDVAVVLVSVDPDRDTLERAGEYVDYFDPSFIAAVGSLEDTARVAQQVNVAFAKLPGETPDSYLIEHSGQIVVFNPRGHYHAFMRLPHEGPTIAAATQALMRRFSG